MAPDPPNPDAVKKTQHMKKAEIERKKAGIKATAQLAPDPPNPDAVKKTQHMKKLEIESKKEAKKPTPESAAKKDAKSAA